MEMAKNDVQNPKKTSERPRITGSFCYDHAIILPNAEYWMLSTRRLTWTCSRSDLLKSEYLARFQTILLRSRGICSQCFRQFETQILLIARQVVSVDTKQRQDKKACALASSRCVGRLVFDWLTIQKIGPPPLHQSQGEAPRRNRNDGSTAR
jgi:hypothetical protein